MKIQIDKYIKKENNIDWYPKNKKVYRIYYLLSIKRF